MKFKKEEIQKIFLGALMAIGVVYAYFQFVLGPLQKRQVLGAKELTAIGPLISAAEEQIAKTEALRVLIPGSEATMTQVNGMIPEGSPIAWFPPLMNEYFRVKPAERIGVRNLNTVNDPLIEGYMRMSWSVDLPKAELLPFLRILSDFENKEPLMEIPSITFDSLRDDPEFQRVGFTVVNLVK